MKKGKPVDMFDLNLRRGSQRLQIILYLGISPSGFRTNSGRVLN